ncbi:MAG: VWA domain-containing protein, partial [Planctomycetes bacterium]|nr:VWA domain-containing protein [Planctomycetota bacterium]
MTFQMSDFLSAGLCAGTAMLLVGIWSLYKYRARLTAFTRSRSGVPERFGFLSQCAGLALGISTLLLMALALAGPQDEPKEDPALKKGMDLLFVVDVSKSMAALEGGMTRLQRAVREIRGLTDALMGERVGLIAFAGEAELVCPLTEDLPGFCSFLDILDPYTVRTGGTALGPAVEQALS